MLFNLGCVLSKNLPALLVCRLFAGIFGSTSMAVAFGSVYDMFPSTYTLRNQELEAKNG